MVGNVLTKPGYYCSPPYLPQQCKKEVRMDGRSGRSHEGPTTVGPDCTPLATMGTRTSHPYYYRRLRCRTRRCTRTRVSRGMETCRILVEKAQTSRDSLQCDDKEWLAVVEAVSTHWRHLVEGRPCIVRTDHRPLLGKLTKTFPIPPLLPRQARWIERLSGFNLQLQHLSGAKNTIADALSRAPEFYANAIDLPQTEISLLAKLQSAAQQDAQYLARSKMILRDQQEAQPKYGNLSVKDGLIYRAPNICEVPFDPSLRTLLLELNHDDPLAGHFGRDRTLHSLKRKWYWPNMPAHVDQFVRSCNTCQRSKPTKPSLVGPTANIASATMGRR